MKKTLISPVAVVAALVLSGCGGEATKTVFSTTTTTVEAPTTITTAPAPEISPDSEQELGRKPLGPPSGQLKLDAERFFASYFRDLYGRERFKSVDPKVAKQIQAQKQQNDLTNLTPSVRRLTVVKKDQATAVVMAVWTDNREVPAGTTPFPQGIQVEFKLNQSGTWAASNIIVELE